jgi:hypothetical protein
MKRLVIWARITAPARPAKKPPDSRPQDDFALASLFGGNLYSFYFVHGHDSIQIGSRLGQARRIRP